MSSANMQKKTICFFCNADWYFQLHWLDRAVAAMNSGYEIHLITGKTSNEIIDNLKEAGIHCHPIPFVRGSLNPFHLLVTLHQLQLSLRHISPDIVHSVTLLPAIQAGLLSFLNSYRLIASITGLGLVFSKLSIKNFLLKCLVKFLFRYILKYRFDALFFENYDDRDSFINESMCTFEQTIVVNGAGVDTNIFCNANSINPESTIKFLFASRLLMSKGLPVLIKSCNALYAINKNFELVICGIEDNSSPDAISEELVNQWKKLPYVRWLGHVREMSSVIISCDVIVLPTTYGEGIPRILIEAASCSKPMITTDSSGCRDIVVHHKTGILVPASDASALTEAMSYIINSPSFLKSWGENARALVLEHFDKNIVIQKTLATYSRLLK